MPLLPTSPLSLSGSVTPMPARWLPTASPLHGTGRSGERCSRTPNEPSTRTDAKSLLRPQPRPTRPGLSHCSAVSLDRDIPLGLASSTLSVMASQGMCFPFSPPNAFPQTACHLLASYRLCLSSVFSTRPTVISPHVSALTVHTHPEKSALRGRCWELHQCGFSK